MQKLSLVNQTGLSGTHILVSGPTVLLLMSIRLRSILAPPPASPPTPCGGLPGLVWPLSWPLDPLSPLPLTAFTSSPFLSRMTHCPDLLPVLWFLSYIFPFSQAGLSRSRPSSVAQALAPRRILGLLPATAGDVQLCGPFSQPGSSLVSYFFVFPLKL